MVEEIDYVDGTCRYCGADFVAMSPDEARRHMVEDHDDILAEFFVWPTEMERRKQELHRYMTGITDNGGPWQIVLDDKEVGVTIAAHKAEDKLAVQQGDNKPDIISRSALTAGLSKYPTGSENGKRKLVLVDQESGEQLLQAMEVVALNDRNIVVTGVELNPYSPRVEALIDECQHYNDEE